MTNSLKLIKIGNSVGLVLPKDVLSVLGATLGDTVDLVKDPEGGLKVRRHDAGFSEQMKVAREVMERRRAALAELAK